MGQNKATCLRGASATRGKADQVTEATDEDEVPPEPLIAVPLPLPRILTAWHCAHPFFTEIAEVKTHSEWPTLDLACLLLHKVSMVQSVYPFYDLSDPNDALFISKPDEASSSPESREFFS